MGLWVDQGLEDLHKQLLGAASLGEPSQAALFTNNYTPTPGDDLSAYSVDGATVTPVVPGDWTFTLDVTNHQDLAQQVVNFDLSLLAGNNYWGIVVFNATATVLYFAQNFGNVFTVPPGGLNPAPFVLLDYRKDCST